MNLAKRETFPALNTLQDEMNSLFRRFVNQPLMGITGWFPPVNLEESDNEIVVTAELPGVDPKNVTISIEGRDLVISGEKKSTRTEKKENYHLEELSYGSFLRRLPLPCEVATGKTSGDYKSGMLRITLPKADTAKRSKIAINVTKD